MQKRGISTIVASVLIVLITVASVSILWFALYPIINQALYVEDPNVQVQIDKSPYTFYDSDNDLASIRVTRGADSSNIIGLKFIATNIDGSTCTVVSEDVVKQNSAKVYDLLIDCADDLVEVSVVPVYDIKGRIIEGQNLKSVTNLPKKDFLDEKGGIPQGVLFLDEIDDLSVFDNGLVAYYPFSNIVTEGSDERTFDYTGNGNDGIANNGIAVAEDILVLDGTDDYVSAPFTVTDDISISLWLKADDSAQDYNQGGANSVSLLWIKDDSPSFRWYEVATEHKLRACVSVESSPSPYTNSHAISEYGYTSNEWIHLVLISDKTSDKLSFYLNGILQESKDFDNDILPPHVDNIMWIGADEAGRYLKGEIDDVAIFNRCLSEEDIEQLYNKGRN